jgi:hypothetical protein
MIAVSNILPLPNPPLYKATVYTQVIESPLFLKLPHPNPPRCFGEGTNFSGFPPKHRGIKGGNNVMKITGYHFLNNLLILFNLSIIDHQKKTKVK